MNRQQLAARLAELHRLTAQTPLYNPVFQLGLEISRDLESGAFGLAEMEELVEQLEAEALDHRAGALERRMAPLDPVANEAAFRRLIENLADGSDDFALFARRANAALLHIVFTAHPTFLLRAEENARLVRKLTGEMPEGTMVDPGPITLDQEHAQAMDALTSAASARDRMCCILYDVARDRWPDRWRDLRPVLFPLATWVGYDIDGRTDIDWSTSIAFRLEEKARKLAIYADAADRCGQGDIARTLNAAADHSTAMAAAFRADLDRPQDLSQAANALTRDHPDKLLSLTPVIAALRAAARNEDGERARDISCLASAMETDGLGLSHIHFRVNSAQLHNAIRRRIDPDNNLDLASGTALHRLRTLLDEVRPLRTNFAATAIENTTAIRQFLVMAQILHHIDADTPIRMLIAECETPVTVLAALYLARMFGIEDRVDVSPLFETESAMEHGGRFLESLLGQPHYQAYARTRGRVAIQTGFSDAGRFVGQIPAALAIERLHGRLAQAMEMHGLTDVAALIFNTHGESMGRGAHPASVEDRLTYPMSRWARAQFARRGIATQIEVSFQGGDGFLPFKTEMLALAMLSRIAEVELDAQPGDAENDPFYDRTDVSLDFYRGIRQVQRKHLESRSYARAITAFGLGLLNETGSRKSRRQSDLASDRDMSLRQIRAIPHNAILQQLGYPVNIIAGMGTAAEEDRDAVAALLSASPRGQQLLRMVLSANAVSSIKTVAAYGELFNSAYWASRPYRGTEMQLEPASLDLAEKLINDDRTGAFRRLASRLRVDAVKLHRLLKQLDISVKSDPQAEARRRALGVLHALRLALIQHMFLRAVQVPVFSRRNDISRDDVLDMVLSLRIDDAVIQLQRAYPTHAPGLDDFAVEEPSDYPDTGDEGYAFIQRDYIEPIARAQRLSLRIGTAIANYFGAHG